MKMMILASILSVSVVGGAEPEAREWQAPNGTLVKYRWHAPEPVEPGKTYPLILFLHGAGERGSDNAAQLKHGVSPILEGARKLGEPCFLIAPQCPKDQWWGPLKLSNKPSDATAKPASLLDAVLALAESMTKTHPIDPKRFYVTGLSMGGYGTWSLLAQAPNKIAAAVPICGGGDPAQAAKFKRVPIWAFHGEADPVVPVTTTRAMIAALEKAGGKPKATYYPKVQHDSWTQTYADPAVFKWLFAQRRK
jgi:predicted peptidase